MIEADDDLAEMTKLYRRSIAVPSTRSKYVVLSADVKTKHGLNAHGIILDELHTQPNRDLYDVLVTSTGARTQPLTLTITTAGTDKKSICFQVYQYAQRVAAGDVDDPTFLAVLFEAAKDDDWTDPAVWRKANPSIGHTVTEEAIDAEVRKARDMPSYENTVRRLLLNQWVEAATRWIGSDSWQRCAAAPAPFFPGRRVWGGLDLASTTDVAALIWVAEGDGDGMIDVLCRFWIPEDQLAKRIKRDRVPYDVWERDGYLVRTPGNVIDYDFIAAQIEADAELLDVQALAYDRWGALQLVNGLRDNGLPVVPIGQGFASMGAPSKSLERLVLGAKLRHGGNPVLAWMAANVVTRTDPAGNIKPDKERSTEKIDGIVALIMALARHDVHEEEPENPLETHGIRSV